MLQVHERLGDFEIIRLLGKGGMGEVYEARQFNPDRHVALKVLAPWLADDEDALERFWREAAVPAKLDHPSIVRIISQGKTPDGVAYFTMHLVRGISLAEMIKRTSSSPSSEVATRTVDTGNTPSAAAPPSSEGAPVSPAPDEAVETNPPLAQDYRRDRFTTIARIGIQVARALASAHHQGYLHRDIKPSNLMVDHHDQVYLVDFGLTRGLGPTSDSTNPGTVIGTPWYMSPEQADGKVVDARSDIYSLGVTLYELATQGLGPFTASRDDKKGVLAQVRAGQALPLRTLAQGIPAPLERIIVRAMQLKPNKRYGSVADMAKELEAFLGVPSKGLSHPAPRPMLTPRRLWPVWIACATTLVAVAFAVAAFLNRDREPVGPAIDNKDKKDVSISKRVKFDGSQAEPPALRIADRGVGVPLVDFKHEPRWSEKLFGKAEYRILDQQMDLVSTKSEEGRILALADPDWTRFEFEIEISPMSKVDNTYDHDAGVVFGWRRDLADSSDPGRFFLVQLNGENKITGDPRTLKIGTARIIKAGAKRTDTIYWLKELPIPGAITPLPKAKNRWDVVKVRVKEESVKVSVNNVNVEFTLAQIRTADPPAAENLATHGAVGIWSRMGIGMFRKPSLTLLPTDN